MTHESSPVSEEIRQLVATSSCLELLRPVLADPGLHRPEQVCVLTARAVGPSSIPTPAAAEIWARPLADMQDEPLQVLAFDRVLVVLECGHALSGAEFHALETVISRPPDTYLVAVVGCELLGDPSDVELLERSLVRSIPSPAGDGARPRFEALRTVLTAEVSIADPRVQDRIDEDAKVLRAWLAAPGPSPSSDSPLEVARTLAWLDAIDGVLDRTEVEARATSHAGRETRAVLTALVDLRSDVRGLVDRSLADLVEAVDSDLVARRDAVAHQLRAWAAQGGGPGDPGLGALRDGASRGLDEWRREADRRLAAWPQDLGRQVVELCREAPVGWGHVDAAAGLPGAHPQCLVADLHGAMLASAHERPNLAQSADRASSSTRTVGLIVGGGVVGALMLAPFAAALVGAAVGVATGYAAGEALNRYEDRTHRLAQANRLIETWRTGIEAGRVETRGRISAGGDAVRAVLDARFADLEQAVRSAPSRGASTGDVRRVRRVAQALRARVKAPTVPDGSID